jgi:hypothetical protein
MSSKVKSYIQEEIEDYTFCTHIVLHINYNLPWLLLLEKFSIFSHLSFVVNIVCYSSKYRDDLQVVKLEELSLLLEMSEFDSGKRQNILSF